MLLQLPSLPSHPAFTHTRCTRIQRRRSSTCLGMSTSAKCSQPRTDNPAYFWMPEDEPYGAFSHWYAAPMTNSDGIFPTVEHYMMYQKAKLFKDLPIMNTILSCSSPEEAKVAGRKVHNFDSQSWKEHREQIVYEGNWLKFSQHPHLADMLLETGNRPLIEASPEDSLWGIGFSADKAASNRENWGQNLCGKAIERVRAALCKA